MTIEIGNHHLHLQIIKEFGGIEYIMCIIKKGDYIEN